MTPNRTWLACSAEHLYGDGAAREYSGPGLAGHWLFHSEVRTAVRTVLLVAGRLQPHVLHGACSAPSRTSSTAQTVGSLVLQQQPTEKAVRFLTVDTREIWQFIMSEFFYAKIGLRLY